MARIHSVGGQLVTPLREGWELCSTAPGAAATPGVLDGRWIPATVPGTAAQALRDAGEWSLDHPAPLHGLDFWFRIRFSADGPRTLRFHGLATLAEVWLNGEKILSSDNMFLAHQVEAACAGENELLLCFRALAPALAAKKGRARWRPRMIQPGTLRFVRTTLLGHMPGWCPPVHAVGPWRPVELVEETGPLRVLRADVVASTIGDQGMLEVGLEVEWTGTGRPTATVEWAGESFPMKREPGGSLQFLRRLEGVKLWWPHTHGEPALYPLRATVGGVEVDLGQVGFRSIEVDDGEDGQSFALRVNGERVFCRGGCWSSADLVSLAGDRAAYEPWLLRMRDAGMNMVRVGGTMAYEGDDFFALCDELGILVWQDYMFANLDYPFADPAFAASVTREAEQLLDRVQASPSLAVLCGGSEVEQQSAMLGLPREGWKSPLFGEILPALSERLRPDVPYVPNSPSGGDLPFLANRGVTHYYGVGAYLRPLDDARRAEVRFASECLAFANVPEPATITRVLAAGEAPGHHPKWKERVPRDVGASWDFEDVREHYLSLLYDVDPLRLRYEDPERWLRLSRAVTGEVMEEVFAEWRRGRSTCAGGLVWLYQDLWPGAGWGVVDSLGAPKAAWHALRRAFRPIQVTLSDEGVNGLALHLLNETPRPVEARLSLRFLRGEATVAQAERAVLIPARGALELSAASMLDAFFDSSYAYRFGPPAHEVAVAALHDAAGERLADAFHFPRGRSAVSADPELGAEVERSEGGWALRLRARRLAQSVHLEDEHYRGEEEWFHLAPGAERLVALLPRDASGALPDGELFALNASAPTRYRGAP
jgi:beta-mannosidase